MDKPNYLLVRETWPWMAQVSGFDPLFAAIERQPEISAKNIFVPEKEVFTPPSLAERIIRKIGTQRVMPTYPPAPSPFVAPRHEKIGEQLIATMTAELGSTAILSAGENQYGGLLSNASAAIRSRLVACFHQPPSWWRLHWRKHGVLDGLKGIVCLSKEQEEYFAAITSASIIPLRHGVVLDFFTPVELNDGHAPRLLFVGHWLRNLELLEEAMKLIWQTCPEVELDCVIPFHARDRAPFVRMARNSKVRWHAGLSAEELRELYRRATLFFLPLIDCTANNGIVEALACGLPIISTRVGGIVDYVPEDCGQLCQPDMAKQHAEAVLSWLGDRGQIAKARLACREYAVRNLDWNKIAASFLDSLTQSVQSK